MTSHIPNTDTATSTDTSTSTFTSTSTSTSTSSARTSCATATPPQHFIWGCGRLHSSTSTSTSTSTPARDVDPITRLAAWMKPCAPPSLFDVDPSPKLLEAISTALRQIITQRGRTHAITHSGVMYSNDPSMRSDVIPPSSATSAAASAMSPSADSSHPKFGRVRIHAPTSTSTSSHRHSHSRSHSHSHSESHPDMQHEHDNNDIPQICHIATSSQHTLAVTTSGRVYQWTPISSSSSSASTSTSASKSTSTSTSTSTSLKSPEVSVSTSPSPSISPSRSLTPSSTPSSPSLSVSASQPRLSSSISSTSLSLPPAAAAAAAGSSSASPSPHLPTLVSYLSSYSIRMVACGSDMTIVMTSQGRLLSWGNNTHGACGLNTWDPFIPNPTELPLPSSGVATQITCGWSHVAMINEHGHLYTWGCGLSGRLGHGDTKDVNIPMRCEGVSELPIIQVAAGYHHTAALDVSGRVWCFGGNETGQLGLGDSVTRVVPTPVPLPDHQLVSIASGPYHMAAVTAVGELLTWGCGESGQLMHNERCHELRPRLVEALSGMDVCLVACGGEYTIAVTDHFMVVQPNYFSDRRDSHPTLDIRLPAPSDSLAASGAGSGSRTASQLIVADPLIMEIPTTRGRSLSITLQRPSSRRSSTEPVSATAASTSTSPIPVIYDETLPHTRTFTSATSNASRSNGTAHAHAHGAARLSRASTHGDMKSLVNSASSSSSFSSSSPSLPSPPITQPSSPSSSSVTSTSAALSSLSSTIVLPAPRPSSPSPSSSFSSSSSSSSAPSSVPEEPPRRSIFQLMKQVLTSSSSTPTLTLTPAPVPAATVPSSDKVDVSSVESRFVDPRQQIPMFSNYRPSNLPPKSASDASRHRAEVERLNRLYRDKLQREAKGKALIRQEERRAREKEEKARKVEEKKQIEREQQLEESSAVWLQQIVPNWDKPKFQQRAREMVYKIGIPPRVRGHVWPLALGNALMITPDLYEIFGKHAKKAREQKMMELKQQEASRENVGDSGATPTSTPTAADPGASSPSTAMSPTPSFVSSPGSGMMSSPSSMMPPLLAGPAAFGKENTFSYIDVDLTRTFPSLAFFQDGVQMNSQLRDILDTYCFYRPDVGYVQGMSYLAGNFLLYMSPYMAFVCFANLLNSPFFHVFLKLDPPRMQARYAIFQQLFAEQLPDLHKHFLEEGVVPDLYFMEWCMTLFCKRLKLDVVGRVWDCYLVEGEAVVYTTGVAILMALRDQLLGEPFEKCIRNLTRLPQTLSEDALMSCLERVEMSSALQAKLKLIREH